MKEIDLLIHSASQLCTISSSGPQRGSRLGQLNIIEDGAIAVSEGTILDTGHTADLTEKYQAQTTINAAGCCIMPGFVDPHTHLPWSGDRAGEFEQRLAGATYMEIMAAGGGIMSTVRQTREASLEKLVGDNLRRLANMLAFGTTSAEAKTGYGLETETELKQLSAIKTLNARQPVELTPTFLAAHAVPAEYSGQTEEYVSLVIEEMLPAAARWMEENDTSLYCDVFCEDGVFDLDQTRRILEKAKALGFGLKVHADEFVGLGGTANPLWPSDARQPTCGYSA